MLPSFWYSCGMHSCSSRALRHSMLGEDAPRKLLSSCNSKAGQDCLGVIYCLCMHLARSSSLASKHIIMLLLLLLLMVIWMNSKAALPLCRLASCLAAQGVPNLTVQVQPAETLSCLLSLMHGFTQMVADISRVIQLVVLLVPLACWGPLALKYSYMRPQWIHSFR